MPNLNSQHTNISHELNKHKMQYFSTKLSRTMPCCGISDRAQMSKTIIAVRHFGLGGRESLETAVISFAVGLFYTYLQKSLNHRRRVLPVGFILSDS